MLTNIVKTLELISRRESKRKICRWRKNEYFLKAQNVDWDEFLYYINSIIVILRDPCIDYRMLESLVSEIMVLLEIMNDVSSEEKKKNLISNYLFLIWEFGIVDVGDCFKHIFWQVHHLFFQKWEIENPPL